MQSRIAFSLINLLADLPRTSFSSQGQRTKRMAVKEIDRLARVSGFRILQDAKASATDTRQVPPRH